MIYRGLDCRQRVHLWATLGFAAIAGVGLLASDNPVNPTRGGDWVTFPNVISGLTLLLGAGTVWQQWKDAQKAIERLEARLDRLEADVLPETYVRKDVFEERLGRSARGRG